MEGAEELSVVVGEVGVTVVWGCRGRGGAVGGVGRGDNGGEGRGWRRVQEEGGEEEGQLSSAAAVFAGLWRHVCARLSGGTIVDACALPPSAWLALKK